MISFLGPMLPRSLVGRVFALYTPAMVGFVCTGLGLFYRYQFALELERAQQHADTIAEVVTMPITESAVIGDYDTIQRTLERAIRRSDFASAVFIDTKGGAVRANSTEAGERATPAWLKRMIEERLFDTNLAISAGGHDYGVLRMSFAAGGWQLAGRAGADPRAAQALVG